MAIEYGSSPPAQGTLRAASGGRRRSASQPARACSRSSLEGPVVAEEPALGDHDLLDQRLELVAGAGQDPARSRPGRGGPAPPSGPGPRWRSGCRPPRRDRARSARPGAARSAPGDFIPPPPRRRRPAPATARLDELEQPVVDLEDRARGRGRRGPRPGRRPAATRRPPGRPRPARRPARAPAAPRPGLDQDDPGVEPVEARPAPIRRPRSTTGTVPPR